MALLIAQVNGAIADVTDLNSNWVLIEATFTDLGPYVISGLVPSAGSGLSVNVTAGVAVIGGHVAPSGTFVIGSLTPSTTNHLFLLQAGTGSANTSGTPPANSVKLGTATTDGTGVTAVNVLRSGGRQALVRGENMVPGDPGSMGSIDLADWAASAADGVQVFGVLPAGALPSVATKQSVSMALFSGFSPSATGADVYEATVPYSPANGTSSLTWTVRRITFRVSTAGGAPQVTVEKYTGTGVFAATTVGSVTLGSGAYEGAQTAAFTTSTLTSGDKVRINVNTLGTATGWAVDLLLGEA